MAPSYAIIFMADLEQRMLAGYPLKPLHYFRYIDDIFFLWPHGLPSSEYDKHICNLVGYFLNNNYPLFIIKEGIRKASVYPRDKLLTYKPKVENSRIPLVFDYSPKTERLHKTIRSDYSILKSDSSISELFNDPPLTARRQPPSLKTLHLSSRLLGARNIGNAKCSKPRCQVCHFIITDKEFTPPGTKCIVRPPPLDCDTPNVVYLLFCNIRELLFGQLPSNICDKGNYVGQTSNKFRFRFNNHKKTIQDKSVNFHVAKHFCGEPNHSISNLKCILLGSNYQSVNERLKSESKWVVKLSTHISLLGA
ncbi:hypothetical protein HOLleu_09441 [Holothuria leucospilota]|uniref:Reverse transcriptase domain-containing protein n=1 Tax=Holothuria leucospilota TaxID=206669 RepID=A0A9Q1CCX8_HOLLE|nr:hypothetical protein HOLleu_09441 [Holothuria leucospilota]